MHADSAEYILACRLLREKAIKLADRAAARFDVDSGNVAGLKDRSRRIGDAARLIAKLTAELE